MGIRKGDRHQYHTVTCIIAYTTDDVYFSGIREPPMPRKVLYGHIGYLLYGITHAHKRLSQEENDAITQIIHTYWNDRQHASDSLLPSNYILMAFEYLAEQGADAQEGVRFFEDYYARNANDFTDETRVLLQKTIDHLANLASGTDYYYSLPVQVIGK